MNSASVFALFLTVLGACTVQSISIINRNTGAGISGGLVLPSLNTHVQTGVVENPASFIPSYIPPTSVSQSSHNLRTIVRPQIRNEIISVPTVDRLVRLVSSPVVEVISENCGSNARRVDVPTFASGSILSRPVVGGFSGITTGVYPSTFGTVDTLGCGSNIVI